MPRISRAPSTHCPGLSISPFQVAVDPMLQWTMDVCGPTLERWGVVKQVAFPWKWQACGSLVLKFLECPSAGVVP